ncbi:substrate-binding periplasmic protein [Thalassotalea piscium]
MNAILKWAITISLIIPMLFVNGYTQSINKTIITGLNKPPYVFEETHTGIQLDLISEAFKDSDFVFSYMHIPLGRGVTGYQQFNADVLLTVLPDFKFPEMHISQPYVFYQNIAVSLLENDFSIKSIEDLAGKNISAFQNAKKFLGDKFDKISTNFMSYRELPEQQKQIQSLFLHRTDVIILDINIFKSYLRRYADSDLAKPFKVHYIFDERPYSAGFRSEALRDTFDASIKEMRANGTYQLIVDKYL